MIVLDQFFFFREICVNVCGAHISIPTMVHRNYVCMNTHSRCVYQYIHNSIILSILVWTTYDVRTLHNNLHRPHAIHTHTDRQTQTIERLYAQHIWRMSNGYLPYRTMFFIVTSHHHRHYHHVADVPFQLCNENCILLFIDRMRYAIVGRQLFSVQKYYSSLDAIVWPFEPFALVPLLYL